jgi:hypothetical protein
MMDSILSIVGEEAAPLDSIIDLVDPERYSRHQSLFWGGKTRNGNPLGLFNHLLSSPSVGLISVPVE